MTTSTEHIWNFLEQVPDPEILLTEDFPSIRTPLGIKGAGEAGITGAAGAIASAIDNAIGIPGAVTETPVSPQRLKKILSEHGK